MHGLHRYSPKGPAVRPRANIDGGQQTVHTLWISQELVMFMSILGMAVLIRQCKTSLHQQPKSTVSILASIAKHKTLYDLP